jgi:hypothetical protein
MATATHFRVELDDRERLALGKVLRAAKTDVRAWDATPRADGSIVLRPLLEVPADAVSKLSPAAWTELQQLIEEGQGASAALLRAAAASRAAIAAGVLVRQGADAEVISAASARRSTASTGAHMRTRRTGSTRKSK